MKIALDPTPFHHDFDLLEFPRVADELGFEYLRLTPHRDFILKTITEHLTRHNWSSPSPSSASVTRGPSNGGTLT